jgi:PPOX class probable FMN-dependent enzyme
VTDSRPVETLDELHRLYGEPVPSSITKEVDRLTPLHQRYIEASPFVLLATAGPEGLDCSPRGDPAGFVRVADERTLLMPDRRGNNRIDSLRNIVRDPRVALLFLVPGIGVTLRVNGTARLLTDDDLLAGFAMGDKLPATVIEITAERVYTQCPKALIRSKLWDPSRHRTHDDVPTVGQIMEQITAGELDGDAYDAAYPDRLRQSIY